MDAADLCMAVCAASMFLGLIVDDAGMHSAAAVFWGICIACLALAYYSTVGRGRKKPGRKKKKRR